MGYIPEQEIRQIRERADLVALIGEHVPLKRSGRNFKGLCPFHAEKTPSFMVNPDRQIFHCFGCGEGGDVFRFFMRHQGYSFVDAVESLAERYGMVLTRQGDAAAIVQRREKKDQAFQLNHLVARFYQHQLARGASDRARAYLEKRVLTASLSEQTLLGYAPATGQALLEFLKARKAPLALAEELGLIRTGASGPYDFFRDRLIFAILSPEGKVLGFSGRALQDDQQPKYLNSPDSFLYNKGESLLGLSLARPTLMQEKKVVVVEGNVDWLRLVQEGLGYVVAPLGTALTAAQVRLLKRWTDEFILIFDGDEAGLKASDRALELFLPMGLMPRVVLLPEGEDPDTFVRSFGIEALKKKINDSKYLLDVVIDRIGSLGAQDPQQKSEGIKELTRLFSLIPGKVEKTVYVQRIADKFGLPEKTLWEVLDQQSDFSKISRNFSRSQSDLKDQVQGKIPPLEKALVEIVLTGSVDPGPLFESIQPRDFSHAGLQEVWKASQELYQEAGQHLDVRMLLDRVESDGLRQIISQLAVSAESWEHAGAQALDDCLKKFHSLRIRDQLKALSDQIRQAEQISDLSLLKKLVQEKNDLMRKMKSVH